MPRSRLSKRLIKKSIRNLFLSVIAITAIIFLLLKYGIPLLVNVSLFLSGASTDQESQSKNESLFITPPILSTEYIATNSAQIKISGTSSPNQTVMLYNNGSLADKVSTSEKGDFSSIIKLNPKENIVKAKTVSSDGKESGFSENLTIFYINSPPTLEISSPSDGETFNKEEDSAEIRGKTESRVRVTVNGFWATIDNSSNFIYNLRLKEGLNVIEVAATDQAGNETKKKLNVTYYP